MSSYKLILTIGFVLIVSTSFCQEVAMNIKKKKFVIDELIEVTYKINFRYDSIQNRSLKEFKMTGPKSKYIQSYYENGEPIYIETHKMNFHVAKKGKYEIQSSRFFLDGKFYEAKPVKIKVK